MVKDKANTLFMGKTPRTLSASKAKKLHHWRHYFRIP